MSTRPRLRWRRAGGTRPATGQSANGGLVIRIAVRTALVAGAALLGSVLFGLLAGPAQADEGNQVGSKADTAPAGSGAEGLLSGLSVDSLIEPVLGQEGEESAEPVPAEEPAVPEQPQPAESGVPEKPRQPAEPAVLEKPQQSTEAAVPEKPQGLLGGLSGTGAVLEAGEVGTGEVAGAGVGDVVGDAVGGLPAGPVEQSLAAGPDELQATVAATTASVEDLSAVAVEDLNAVAVGALDTTDSLELLAPPGSLNGALTSVVADLADTVDSTLATAVAPLPLADLLLVEPIAEAAEQLLPGPGLADPVGSAVELIPPATDPVLEAIPPLVEEVVEPIEPIVDSILPGPSSYPQAALVAADGGGMAPRAVTGSPGPATGHIEPGTARAGFSGWPGTGIRGSALTLDAAAPAGTGSEPPEPTTPSGPPTRTGLPQRADNPTDTGQPLPWARSAAVQPDSDPSLLPFPEDITGTGLVMPPAAPPG